MNLIKILFSVFCFWLSGSLLALGLLFALGGRLKNLATPFDDYGLQILAVAVLMHFAANKIYALLFDQQKDEGKWINRYKNFINRIANRLKKHYRKNLPQPDNEPVHQLMSVFREHYNDYFQSAEKQKTKINQHNSQQGLLHVVQGNVTQTLWDRLYLHKRRLKQLGVSIDYDVKRAAGGFIDFFSQGSRDTLDKHQTSTAHNAEAAEKTDNQSSLPFEPLKPPTVQSIIVKRFRERQFVLYEIFESIKSTVTYRLNGKKIKTLKNNHYAYYEILNADKLTNDHINCPTCGAASSIEGLYDGCDFCGTQFAVDNLGLKVANFSIKKDIRAKFAKIERRISQLVYSVYLFILWLAYSFLLPYFLYDEEESIFQIFTQEINNHGTFLGILSATTLIILLIITALICFFFVSKIGYWLVALGLKLIAWILYFFINLHKKKINQRAYNADFLQQIRSLDTHFTYNNFYASALEKVMILYFADNSAEIQGISTVPFEHQHKNVVDLQFDDIYITDFHHNDQQMHITIKVVFQQLTLTGKKIKQKRHTQTFGLVKNISEKTEGSIRVLQCHHCGGTLPIISGRFCQYCRSEINFMDYDWVIDKG